MSLEYHSFARLLSKICRCAASWARNPNWLSTTPRTAATTSWYHESPSQMTAATVSSRAAPMAADRTA